MTVRRRVAQLDLVAVLVLVVLVELCLNRLAVPVLRPPGRSPVWHKNLDLVGLFTFHLASMLALGTAAWKLYEVTVRRDLFVLPARATLAAIGAVFLIIAGWSVLLHPGYLLFHLETSFLVLLILTWMALAIVPGDLFVKVGLLVLVVPFALHYYSTFALRFLMTPDAAQGSPLPGQLRDIGQWSVALAAIVVQVCFAPRPWHRHALRPAPLLVAGFVGAVSAVVMRRRYEVGMELASLGLGIELGPGAPLSLIALYVLAAAAVAWTLTSTLTADSPARRQIGAGFALIACGGYGFTWPLQFLSAVCGALAIAEAGARVAVEERLLPPASPPPLRRVPPVVEPIWAAYVDALAAAVRAKEAHTTEEGSRSLNILSGTQGSVSYALVIERVHGVVHTVELRFGEIPEGEEPSLTLLARLEGVLWSAHPSPPPTTAPPTRTGDAAFDRRFRVQDAGGVARSLLDDALRARAAALLDGWVAVWPGRAVQYRVHPGRGAPIDHPIPIPTLALSMGDATSATERLVRVFDLLEEIAERATDGNEGKKPPEAS